MGKPRDRYKIEIVIETEKDDELGFELSLDQAVDKIKDGYLLGRDGNENEEYSFGVKKDTVYPQ